MAALFLLVVSMRERYVQVLLQYRYIGLILVLLFAGISMAGVFKLSFTSDFRTYFSAQNPQLRAFEDMEQRFSRQDNVYFLITAGTQPIFSEIGLKTLAKITDSGWRLPFAQRVDSLQNFQFTEVEGDELFINDFYSVDELPNDLESLRTTALSHPEIKHKLVSSDGKATAVNVLLNLPKGKSSEASKESVQAARELLQVLQQELDINAPEIVIQLGGSVLSNVTMGEAIQQDIETLLLI
ncbi:MAG: hypothetical protein P1U57_13905, partial [Oleibacter sp.]|nr:hypothetical protein [Thalassolituus sp.]